MTVGALRFSNEESVSEITLAAMPATKNWSARMLFVVMILVDQLDMATSTSHSNLLCLEENVMHEDVDQKPIVTPHWIPCFCNLR